VGLRSFHAKRSDSTARDARALRKPFDGAEFQAALDRPISRLTLARQNAALRRHLGTEK
jgi:hypothetical protein